MILPAKENPVIGIAGLGLIGGSLAKAFRRAGYSVAGFDRSGEAVRAALASGAADEASTVPDVLRDADITFVALYPKGTVEFICRAAPLFRGRIVLDCCGIKGAVCEAIGPAARENGFTFIGGHPMAGTEESGFKAASADLFQGASFLMTPEPGTPPKAVEAVIAAVRAAGFARVIQTTPGEHDRMIAFTSQLPHVLACAYIQSPAFPDCAGFSAGSFRDVSRVAHINAPLWAELFIENKTALCEEIDRMIENMKALRNAADEADTGRLRALLQSARERKDSV